MVGRGRGLNRRIVPMRFDADDLPREVLAYGRRQFVQQSRMGCVQLKRSGEEQLVGRDLDPNDVAVHPRLDALHLDIGQFV